MFVLVFVPLYQSYSFPWAFRLNWYRKAQVSFWSLMAKSTALKSLVSTSFLFLYPLIDDLVLLPLLD